jgi:hypothetical protein
VVLDIAAIHWTIAGQKKSGVIAQNLFQPSDQALMVATLSVQPRDATHLSNPAYRPDHLTSEHPRFIWQSASR